MRSLAFRMLAPVLAFALAAHALASQPDVKERRLANGFQVLLVERPGAGAVHARLVIRAGLADTGALPSSSAEILARTLFGRALQADLAPGNDLDALLRKEEGVHESLRLERVRRLRLRVAEPSPEEQGLAQLHAAHMEELRARVADSSPGDLMDALGATRREVLVGADEITFRLDLPVASFGSWCRLEQQRLHRLALSRFPLEREAWNQERSKAASADREALSILLGTAFSGHPYGHVYESKPETLEALTWSELRAYARTTLSPDRMTLVLVGDLRLESTLPLIQETFGALLSGPEALGRRREIGLDDSMVPGYRRIQANTPGDSRLFMAWRIPPANHPDDLALKVLAQILGGGKSSRLPRRIQGERGLAGKLSVILGVPGGRDSSLLLIDAAPAEGHGLAELEESLHGEILRIQNERLPDEEIRRAQRQVESDQLMVQEDASALAKALGNAVVQNGDWRQAFRARGAGRDLSPDEIQAVAKRYLASGQGITALLETDPLLAPRDPLEGRLARVLGRLVHQKVEDPAQAELVVRETLRQLRMLSVPEREQTLKLLKAQAGL